MEKIHRISRKTEQKQDFQHTRWSNETFLYLIKTIFNMRKHYVIAGLDFIFDKSGKPWFLEANSAPTVHKTYAELYGR